jgi:hypothetical protein
MRVLFIIDVRSRDLYPNAAEWGEQVRFWQLAVATLHQLFTSGFVLRGAGCAQVDRVPVRLTRLFHAIDIAFSLCSELDAWGFSFCDS